MKKIKYQNSNFNDFYYLPEIPENRFMLNKYNL
mgnify:CR=1 FL=1